MMLLGSDCAMEQLARLSVYVKRQRPVNDKSRKCRFMEILAAAEQ